MEASSGQDLVEFREEVRLWLAEHLAPDWRARQRRSPDAFVEVQYEWFRELQGAGYLVPHWPAGWGGGLTTAHQAILHRETARAGAPRLQLHFVSLYHAASTLLKAGTDAQQQRHLQGILDGEVWCQGFSEPDAGSDLSSLRARATRCEGGYVVTGQKVWTSIATHAQWCLLLARTGPEGSGSRGITLFAMAMDSPGLEVRTIRQSTGVAEFCELFLDQVFIPEEHVIGGENGGWAAAHATLVTERGLTMLELSERLSAALEQVEADADLGWRTGGADDLADALLGRARSEVDVLLALAEEFVEQAVAGDARPAEASMLKLLYSEVLQRTLDRMAQVEGPGSYHAGELLLGAGWETGHWALDFMNSGSWTIAGGASEVLRDVVAEQLLGLPRRQRA